MNQYAIPKYTKEVLKQMCREIRVSFSKIDFDDNEWYLKYSWTQYKQEKFIKWLTDYLYNNKEARVEMLALPIKRSKKYLRKVALDFVFSYGWKTKK